MAEAGSFKWPRIKVGAGGGEREGARGEKGLKSDLATEWKELDPS